MFFNENKRKRLHNNRVKFPEDLVGAPTWRSWRHVKTENNLTIILQGRPGYDPASPSIIIVLLKNSTVFPGVVLSTNASISASIYSGPKLASLLTRSLTILGTAGIWTDSLCPASQWKCWKSDMRNWAKCEDHFSHSSITFVLVILRCLLQKPFLWSSASTSIISKP